jgi:hypothetical protein
MNESGTLPSFHRRLFDHVVQTARLEQVRCSPTVLPHKSICLHPMVYHEIYNYRCLQVVLNLGDPSLAESGAGFDYHIGIAGNRQENRLLEINLNWIPTDLDIIWRLRCVWMTSEVPDQEITPIVARLRDSAG